MGSIITHYWPPQLADEAKGSTSKGHAVKSLHQTTGSLTASGHLLLHVTVWAADTTLLWLQASCKASTGQDSTGQQLEILTWSFRFIWNLGISKFIYEFMKHINSYMKRSDEFIVYMNLYMYSYEFIWIHEYMNSFIWIQICRLWIHTWIWIHVYEFIVSNQNSYVISSTWFHNMNSLLKIKEISIFWIHNSKFSSEIWLINLFQWISENHDSDFCYDFIYELKFQKFKYLNS